MMHVLYLVVGRGGECNAAAAIASFVRELAGNVPGKGNERVCVCVCSVTDRVSIFEIHVRLKY